MFNASSADKPAGTGIMEFLSEYDSKNSTFKELNKISNWRKMLSSEYVMELTIEDQQWPSVDHYCIARTFTDKPEVYDRLTCGGAYGTDSISTIKTKLKLKRIIYDKEILSTALIEKFSPKNEVLHQVLRQTQDATLTNWKRGFETTVYEDGNKRALPCLFTDVLTDIRTRLSRTVTPTPQTQTLTPTQNVVPSPATDEKVKVLSHKEVADYNDFLSRYDVQNNKSSNILTIYERTNILGIRMEQLALGADSYLDDDVAYGLGNIKMIALKELEERKIPFLICRVMPDNTNEYWRLADMK
jgi:DNA-directed RNA polymerase subunit K/omega